MSAESYWVSRDGKTYGPYPKERIVQMWSAREIEWEDQFSMGAGQAWISASELGTQLKLPARFAPEPLPDESKHVASTLIAHQRREKAKALNGLSWAAVIFTLGGVFLSVVPPGLYLPWVIILPVMLILFILGIVMLAKGGIGSGLATLFVTFVMFPIVGAIIAPMVLGVMQEGSLEAYVERVKQDQEELEQRIHAREALRERLRDRRYP